MRIIPIDLADAAQTRDALGEAARILRAGGLVAFPTETVYGLGANALDPAAVARIYAAKGRPSYNPLIVHVRDTTMVSSVAREWPATAEQLARAFWPGPLTMVLPKAAHVPDGVTAGLDTVGVRVPSHPVAHALLAVTDLPLAAPSANRSMALSPTRAEHVARSLGDAVDLILDGGPTQVGIESTVVDLSRAEPMLLRPGMIPVDELERVLERRVGVASHDAAVTASGAGLPSPGMMDRHYAPRTRLVLAPGDPKDVSHALEELRADKRRVAVLIRDGSDSPIAQGKDVIRLPRDAASYAAVLFDTLHRLDDQGFDAIFVERVPDNYTWAGVRDRLERAAR